MKSKSGYLLQDNSCWHGNDMVFWGKNHAGYVSNLARAHVFKTAKEARNQVKHVDHHRKRFTVWSKDYLMDKAVVKADMNHIDINMQMKA